MESNIYHFIFLLVPENLTDNDENDLVVTDQSKVSLTRASFEKWWYFVMCVILMYLKIYFRFFSMTFLL